MPNRIVRDGILTSEAIAMLSWAEEVFYRRLMSVVDDHGRFHALPKLVRAACYPLLIDKVSDADIGKWITACVEAGLVSVYPAQDGKRYLQIVKFGQQVRSKSKFSEPIAVDVEQLKSPDINCDQSPANAHLGVVVSVDVGEGGSLSPPPAETLDCPVQKIVDAYHRLMPANPRVRVLDDARRRTIVARWKQSAGLKTGPFGYTNVEEGIRAWETFFEVCAESDFLAGRATPSPGRDKPFVADLDFLLSPKGFKGCLENKYHRGLA